jgi:glycosyltransferase involved in cell wall biosynthesis
VIYSGIDTDRWFRDDSRDDARRTMNLLPHEIVVTLPGRILPSKGHDVFVAAAERVAEHLPTAQFLIVGEGFYAEFDYESELKNVVAHRGLAQRMKFLGFQKDMATVYQASDIIVVPSLIPDSLPTVILEAMAAGKIVIASRIGGAAEIITDGHDGFLVAPGDSEALSQKILGIVRARERWGEIGQRARDRIRESFHHTRYVEEMYLWLQELAMSRAT